MCDCVGGCLVIGDGVWYVFVVLYDVLGVIDC